MTAGLITHSFFRIPITLSYCSSKYIELIMYSNIPCGFQLQRYKIHQPEPFALLIYYDLY